jgi:hypothetical protein
MAPTLRDDTPSASAAAALPVAICARAKLALERDQMPARIHDRDAQRLETGCRAFRKGARDDGIGLSKRDLGHRSLS